MTAPVAIFEPIPDHGRHLFFELGTAGDLRATLKALAAECDGQSVVLGLGEPVAQTLNVSIPGLRPFPQLPHAPALAAVFCGIEKMPPPTIEPTTRAVSAPTRSLVVFGGFMQTSRYQPPTMGWNSST